MYFINEFKGIFFLTHMLAYKPKYIDLKLSFKKKERMLAFMEVRFSETKSKPQDFPSGVDKLMFDRKNYLKTDCEKSVVKYITTNWS